MPTPQENNPSTGQTESQPPSPTGGGTSSHPDSQSLDMRLEAVIARLYGATPPFTSPILSGTARARGSRSATGRESVSVRICGNTVYVPTLTPSERASLQLTKPSSTTPKKPSTSSSIPSSPATVPVGQATLQSVESMPLRHQYMTYEEYMCRTEGTALRYLYTTTPDVSSSSMPGAAAPSPMLSSPSDSYGLSQEPEPPTRWSGGTVDPLDIPEDETGPDPYEALPEGDL